MEAIYQYGIIAVNAVYLTVAIGILLGIAAFIAAMVFRVLMKFTNVKLPEFVLKDERPAPGFIFSQN